MKEDGIFVSVPYAGSARLVIYLNSPSAVIAA